MSEDANYTIRRYSQDLSDFAWELQQERNDNDRLRAEVTLLREVVRQALVFHNAQRDSAWRGSTIGQKWLVDASKLLDTQNQPQEPRSPDPTPPQADVSGPLTADERRDLRAKQAAAAREYSAGRAKHE